MTKILRGRAAGSSTGVGLVVAVSVAFGPGCASLGRELTGGDSEPPPPRDASHFVATANERLRAVAIESDRAAWIHETYITEDTDDLATESTERWLKVVRDLVALSERYQGQQLPDSVARQLHLLRLSTSMPAPSADADRHELAALSTALSSAYGKGKGCLEAGAPCLPLDDLSQLLANERDFIKQQRAWEAWHEVGKPMRSQYARFVQLANDGARQMGFSDLGELWRAGYDMSPQAFEQEVERLWRQVQPLYESLHCYVRMKLRAYYGADKIGPRAPIPAHLLGNMWGQQWGNIYPLVAPYPDQAGEDVTARLQAQAWDATRMMRTGEAFFTSLGLPQLPETFWARSMLTKPADREVVCHASAWDMGGTGDVRIKMCTQITQEDLHTVHHELGHVYYYLMYANLPTLFQRGAHDGFHEGIGDTLVLSVTPGYLKTLGLLDAAPSNPRAELNHMMRRALDQIAFLPFGKLVDQWRWQVFDGRTGSADYNTAWWRLRRRYQGIAPSTPRTEEHFDPGAKYHVPANVPYMRYFLAQVLQFQFHRALCAEAGHRGPLHTCSIFGSRAAGDKLTKMLRLGASRPWPEALATLGGETGMDASALVAYFAPLADYLAQATAGEQCGWDDDGPPVAAAKPVGDRPDPTQRSGSPPAP